MPLIIDPASCCDVCLEPLTYDEPRPPFAIPCGHIFCGECLHMMTPSVCPLCRKPFIADRSKKLITGEGAESDADRTAVSLLQKLVVSWDAGVNDADRVVLVGEVERWFEAGNTHEPLAKANEVIKAYHALRSERHDNYRSLRQLRRELEQREIAQMVEKDNAMAVEQSLLTQVQELHSQVTLPPPPTSTRVTVSNPCQPQIARYEADIEATRKAASTITFRKNPLPRPPEPYPLESLPSFAKRYPATNGESSSQAAPVPPPPPDDYIHPPQGASTDRKGKGRAAPAPAPAPLTPQSPGWSLPSSSSSAALPPLPIFAPSAESESDTPGPQNAIIRGASPSQRFVPRSVFENPPPAAAAWNPVTQVGHAPRPQPLDGPLPLPPVDPYSMAAEYVAQYVGGFEEGYRAVQRAVPPPPQAAPSRRSRPSRHAVTAPPDPIRSPLLEPPPLEPRGSDPVKGPTGIPPEWAAEENRNRRPMEEFGLLPLQAQVSHEGRYVRSSRRPRRLEDFYLGTSSSQSGATSGSNGWGLPAPPRPLPRSAPAQPEFAANARYADVHANEESRGTMRLWMQMVPSTSPVPTDPATAPSATSAQRPVPTHSHSQPVSRLPLPASAPAQPSSSSSSSFSHAGTPQPQSSRHSAARSSWHQRHTSDMPDTGSSHRPSSDNAEPHPPPPSSSSESRSSLRRRSALTGSNLGPQHTPTGSDADRASISSWGTVNSANPAPAATQPIRASAHFIPAADVISVRDLQLRSFEDVEGGMDADVERRSLGSDAGEVVGLSPVQLLVPGVGAEVGGEGEFDRTWEREWESLNRTPRNRAWMLSLAESPASLRPSDHEAQNERARDAYHNPEIPPGPGVWYPHISQSQSHIQYIQSQPQPQSQYVPSSSTATSSGHHSRSSRTRHHRSRRLSPPNPVPIVGALPPRASPSPSWEAGGTSNALGLSDIVPSPEPRISAPTPITSTRAFLRSFSHDSYH